MTRVLVQLFIICSLLELTAKAQSLKETTEQIKNLHNVRLTEIVKFKFSFQDDFSIDTLTSQMAVVAGEPQIGGYYKIGRSNNVYLFDGNKAIWLNLRDTTYGMSKDANKSQFTPLFIVLGKENGALFKITFYY